MLPELVPRPRDPCVHAQPPTRESVSFLEPRATHRASWHMTLAATVSPVPSLRPARPALRQSPGPAHGLRAPNPQCVQRADPSGPPGVPRPNPSPSPPPAPWALSAHHLNLSWLQASRTVQPCPHTLTGALMAARSRRPTVPGSSSAPTGPASNWHCDQSHGQQGAGASAPRSPPHAL